jgi:hypothetical protein
LLKTIPDAPKNEVPIFLRPAHTFAVTPFPQGKPWYPPDYEGPKVQESWQRRYFRSIAHFREGFFQDPENVDGELKQRYERLRQRRAEFWKKFDSESNVNT